jgi:hypothetical protein
MSSICLHAIILNHTEDFKLLSFTSAHKLLSSFSSALCLYSCCSDKEHRASVKRFVSLQFLNLRESVGLLWPVICPAQGCYLTQTQNKHRQTDLTRIWNHDPSIQASEDISCLRPLGHCDWPLPFNQWLWFASNLWFSSIYQWGTLSSQYYASWKRTRSPAYNRMVLVTEERHCVINIKKPIYRCNVTIAN